MGQGNNPNNNQPRQPVPSQGVPQISTQDVRNMEEAKHNDQTAPRPTSPAHQLNLANTEEQNRDIEAFTQRMQLMHGLPGTQNFQQLTVPPQLPAVPEHEEEAPNEVVDDDDHEMKSEAKEEKEEKEEKEDESEYKAAEGDATCSICHYPCEQMVADGQQCDCIATH